MYYLNAIWKKNIYIYISEYTANLNGRQLRNILDGAVATSRGYVDHVNQTNIDLLG